MLNLFNLNSNRRNDEAARPATGPAGGSTAAIIRVTRGSSNRSSRFSSHRRVAILRLDLAELGTLPSTCQLTNPNKDDLLRFILTITPDDVRSMQEFSRLFYSFLSGLLPWRSIHLLF